MFFFFEARVLFDPWSRNCGHWRKSHFVGQKYTHTHTSEFCCCRSKKKKKKIQSIY